MRTTYIHYVVCRATETTWMNSDVEVELLLNWTSVSVYRDPPGIPMT